MHKSVSATPTIRKVTTTTTRTITPTENDILCGRGKIHAKHPGNQKFNDAIYNSLKEYANAASRIEKSCVVATVAKRLLADGHRFLKQDKITKEWFELDRDALHEKTGHAIRDILSNLHPRVENQNNKKKNKSNKKSYCKVDTKPQTQKCHVSEPKLEANPLSKNSLSLSAPLDHFNNSVNTMKRLSYNYLQTNLQCQFRESFYNLTLDQLVGVFQQENDCNIWKLSPVPDSPRSSIVKADWWTKICDDSCVNSVLMTNDTLEQRQEKRDSLFAPLPIATPSSDLDKSDIEKVLRLLDVQS